jgi:hypothetical protein
MAQQLRRYEILLPLVFNDGQRVPAELLEQTRVEIERQVGGVSVETQRIRGFDADTSGGEDKMVRLFADVPDTAEHRAFFLCEKETLKERFRQEEIWITTFAVEAL